MAKDPAFHNEHGFKSSPCGPPCTHGVYAICVMPITYERVKNRIDTVVYIGSSKNIHRRIMNPAHIYRRLINLLHNYWTYTLYLECENYIELERQLIRKYKPRFNKHKYGA